MASNEYTANYAYDPRRFGTSFWMATGIGLAFLLAGSIANVFWFGALMAAICGLIAVRTVLESRRRSPVLSIEPAGFIYTPFSKAIVAWDNVAGVAVVKHERMIVRWGKKDFFHQKQLDTVNVALRDDTPYPRSPWRSITRRLSAVKGRPAISIQPYFLKGASTESVIDAIGRNWTGEVEYETIRYQS